MLPIFLFLIAAVSVPCQTMKALPKIVVKPFMDLSGSESTASLGAAITTMLRSAIDRSLVFQTVTPDPSTPLTGPDLRKKLAPRERKSFMLLEGTVSMLGGTASVDVRVSDLLDDSLIDAISLEVVPSGELRQKLSGLVTQLEGSIFRDTLGSMALTAKPAACNAYLDDRFVGSSGQDGVLRIPRLQPGPYVLRLVSPGFTDYTDTANIQARRTTSFTATLTPEPGSLVIDSDPAGAVIMLDGRNLPNKTPFRVYPVSAGQHKITVTQAGYIQWEKTVSVNSNEEVGIKAVLSLLRGSIRISSNPSGARVVGAGETLGSTPLELQDLEPGEYVFEISLANYASRTVSIQVESGRAASPTTVELPRLTGGFTAHSTPEGADVSIEGASGQTVDIGKTPIDKLELGIGTFIFHFRKEGYFPVDLKLAIKAGATTVAEAPMKFVPGSVRVITDPRFAEVYLNGAFKGVAPLEIADLQPGSYTVVVKSDFGDLERKVEVKPGSVSEETFALTKKPLLFLSGAILAGLTLLFSLGVMGQK
jgi:TolB-like protein